ncbi:unnamed protein product [Darwinula stevensoni]|uniref:Trehalase n=1 Tax=Darwinula stevensoni TaxID=69355 RepID=A0A7R9A8A4_9CRUS|nr:unnamed protein product [Darwinula stevensoni]CAG0896196.1 unnamed protein product [Darwinula stevensoni]
MQSSLRSVSPRRSDIFCHGDLLKTVQLAELFGDSKEFVDMKLRFGPEVVKHNFQTLQESTRGSPTKEEVRRFVEENFLEPGTEFVPWTPEDWTPKPSFLEKIANPALRGWAEQLHALWKALGRKMSGDVEAHPDKHSLVFVPHPTVVPGGRFREFYYWDSYWTLRGLFVSGMKETAKGMIQNFLYMVERFGFVPNGGRVYYQRSQPPYLIPMVKLYLEHTDDLEFLRENIQTLEKEFAFWMNERTLNVTHEGKRHRMARYNVETSGPRPESYKEDYHWASHFRAEEERSAFYNDLKSAAENVIPVDLNSLLCKNAYLLSEFFRLLGNSDRAAIYANEGDRWNETINSVLWDPEAGIWYDYDIKRKERRKAYYLSNVYPLWAGCYGTTGQGGQEKAAERVLDYLKREGVLEPIGGVPTSWQESGEQWDLPNTWAPLQHMLVSALQGAGEEEEAFELARKWVDNNWITFRTTKAMFEKYDSMKQGYPGHGGEYDVQVGFGWTNGVALEFLARYGHRLSTDLAAVSGGGARGGGAAALVLLVAVVAGGCIMCYPPFLYWVTKNPSDFPNIFASKFLAPSDILKKEFNEILNLTSNRPSYGDLKKFVNKNFQQVEVLSPVQPTDWKPKPEFTERLVDPLLKEWALKIHNIWVDLGRTVSIEVLRKPDQYTYIHVPYLHMVPGGKFDSFFYWDSYWICKGLIVSGMLETMQGLILNFISMVERFGYVPNGGRDFLSRRSQPPMLTLLVRDYFQATNDLDFVRSNGELPTQVHLLGRDKIHILVKEYNYWVRNHSIEVQNGQKAFTLFRYNVEVDDPRPEAFQNDLNTALQSHRDSQEVYFHLKSAAESGWDFSSRWFIRNGSNAGELTDISTRNIVPVDLNAFVCSMAKILSDMYHRLGNAKESERFEKEAKNLEDAIQAILWDPEEKMWFDYDVINRKQRKYFYLSNITPIWSECTGTHQTPEEAVRRTMDYLKRERVLDYPGGVPTSLVASGQQWDFPNAWPPLVHILIDGLSKYPDVLEAQTLASQLAHTWLASNLQAFLKYGVMFEKYDVTEVGKPGHGGEYDVMEGFGWTNGVVLDLLMRYGNSLDVKNLVGVRLIEGRDHSAAAAFLAGASVLLGFCGWCLALARRKVTLGSSSLPSSDLTYRLLGDQEQKSRGKMQYLHPSQDSEGESHHLLDLSASPQPITKERPLPELNHGWITISPLREQASFLDGANSKPVMKDLCAFSIFLTDWRLKVVKISTLPENMHPTAKNLPSLLTANAERTSEVAHLATIFEFPHGCCLVLADADDLGATGTHIDIIYLLRVGLYLFDLLQIIGLPEP